MTLFVEHKQELKYKTDWRLCLKLENQCMRSPELNMSCKVDVENCERHGDKHKSGFPLSFQFRGCSEQCF